MKGALPQEVPRPLRTYLFCCPTFDANLRCLPRAGGYYDQDNIDMMWFTVIENRISEIQKRESNKNGR